MQREEAILKLKAISDIACKQNVSLVNGRLGEALTLQEERESIASEIERADIHFSVDDIPAGDIISAIKETDLIISMHVKERLHSVSGNLQKLKEAEPAIAAYNNELKPR